MPTTQVGRLIATLGLDTKKFEKGLNRSLRLATQAGKNMAAIGKTISRSITLPLGLVGVAVVKVAADFDKSIRRVKALTGAVGKEFDALRATALELGRTTAFSAREVAEGMSFLAQAGFETNEVLTTIRGTLDLAAAGAIGLGRSADIASNVLTSFRLKTIEMGRVSDVLAKTFATTNTNLDQLADAFKLAAPSAAGLEFSLEELAGSIGVLGNAGLQGTIAGTALNQFMISLTATTPKAEEAMKRLGFSAFDAQGQLLPLASIVRELEDAQTRLGDSTKFVSELQLIFGRRGFRAAKSLVGYSDELERMGRNLNELGFAQKIAEQQLAGLSGSLVKLRSALEGAAIAIGDAGLADLVQNLAETATEATRGFIELDEKTRKLILTIGFLVAAVGPLVAILGLIVAALATIAANPIIAGAVLATFAVGVGIATSKLQDMADVGQAAADTLERLNDAYKALDNTSQDFFVQQIAIAGKEVFRLSKQIAELEKSTAAQVPGEFGFLGAAPSVAESVNKAADSQQLAELKASLKVASEEYGKLVDSYAASLKEIVDASDNAANSIFKSAKEQAQASAEEIRKVFDETREAAEQVAIIETLAGSGQEEILKAVFKTIRDGMEDIVELGGGASAEVANLASTLRGMGEDIQQINLEEAIGKRADAALKRASDSAADLRAELAALTGGSGVAGSIDAAVAKFESLFTITEDNAEAVRQLVEQFRATQNEIAALGTAIAEAESDRRFFAELASNLQSSLADAIEGAFDDGFDSAKDFAKSVGVIFKKALAQQLAAGITSTLTGTSGTGGLFGSLQGLLSGAGAFFGFGGGSSEFGVTGGQIGPPEAPFGVTGGQIGPALPPGQSSSSSSFGIGQGLSAAVLAVGVVTDIIKSLGKEQDLTGIRAADFKENPLVESIVSGVFTIAGAAIGTIFGGNTGLGGAIGGFAGDIFGTATVRGYESLKSKFEGVERSFAIANTVIIGLINPIGTFLLGLQQGFFKKTKSIAGLITGSPDRLFEEGFSKEGVFGNVGLIETSKRLNAEFREALVDAILNLDEEIAKQLRPEDIALVSSGLAAVDGLRVAFTKFDNEFAQVVFDRVKTIVDSLGADASLVFADVERTGGDVKEEDLEVIFDILEQFLAARRQVQELKDSLFGTFQEVSEVQQAIDALNLAFQDLTANANKFGVDITGIEQAREDRFQELTDSFNKGVLDAIDTIEDPITLAVSAMLEQQEKRLADAILLGADLVEVERLTLLERKALVEELGADIVSVLDSIRGDAAGAASPVDVLDEAQSNFSSLLAAAQGGDTQAFQSVGEAAQNLIEANRSVFGSSATFFESLGFIELTLQNLLDNADSLLGLDTEAPTNPLTGDVSAANLSAFSAGPPPDQITAENSGETVSLLTALGEELSRGNALERQKLDDVVVALQDIRDAQNGTTDTLASNAFAASTASRVQRGSG